MISKESTPNKYEPFFIIGAQRSGTTLLRLMINEHPNICVPNESHFLLKLFKSLPLNKTLTKDQFKCAINIINSESRLKSWNIDPKNISICNDVTIKNIVDMLFTMEAKSHNKLRWGDKTPEYVDILDEINFVYPNAQYIHIIRDGRDAINSYADRGWHGCTIYTRARYWKTTITRIRQFSQKLDNQRYFEVRYEDVIIDPQKTLKEICNFLKEDFSRNMVHHHINASKHITKNEKSRNIHQNLLKPIITTNISKWKKENSLFTNIIVQHYIGDILLCFGYELLKINQILEYTFKLFWPVYLVYNFFVSNLYSLYHILIPNRVKQQLRSTKLWQKAKSIVNRY